MSEARAAVWGLYKHVYFVRLKREIAALLLPIMRRLTAQSSAFLLCDVQEKFRELIFEFPSVIHTATTMSKVSRILDIPLIVTEQNPKALGATCTEIPIEHASLRLAKNQFSMLTPEVLSHFQTKLPGVRDIVLYGIEGHICMLQTSIDLRQNGFGVHVLVDGTSSSKVVHRSTALDRMKSNGCVLTTSETVIFELLGTADHPKFRDLSKVVKEHTAGTSSSLCNLTPL